MPDPSQSRRDDFVVRIWDEGGQARGYATHIPSDEKIAFTSLDALKDFLAQNSAFDSNDAGEGSEA